MAPIEKLFAGLQYLLPHRLLSRLVHAFMRIRLAPVKNLQIAIVGGLAGVDWSEARLQDAADFATFNDFFTRELAAGVRPLDPDPEALVSPSDGRISQCGRITTDRIVQAKGRHFSVRALLGNDACSAEFNNGFFHTIYLSPRDYHRIHMPATGRLVSMTYIPGRLFSVADSLVQNLPNLFNRNERVVCLFETAHGPMAVILVGAIFVGCMDTVWHGTVTPPHGSSIMYTDYDASSAPALNKGDEMGRFNMGSTVIVLWPDNPLSWDDAMSVGCQLQMGQALAHIKPS